MTMVDLFTQRESHGSCGSPKYVHERWFQTSSFSATQRWKSHGPTVISSEAIQPVTDRQTDRHAAYAYVAL